MKNILLIGLGRFGYHVAKELSKLDVQVLAIDKNEQFLREVDEYVTKTIIGDSCDIEFLRSLGINTFDQCIVAIGDDFQASVETVLNLKELSAKVIIARASKESQEKLLIKIGANYVVYPEKQLAKWTALHAGSSFIYDYMQLDGGYGVYEVGVPDSFIGKSLYELDLRKKYQINIVGVKSKNSVNVVISPDFKFSKNESILVVAKEEDFMRCFNIG